MREIKNVYIVHDRDQNNYEYISQVLVEYTNKKVNYYLNEWVESDSIADKCEKEKKIEAKIKDVLKNIKEDEKDKIYMVSTKDKLARRYVNKTIEKVKKNREKWEEKSSLFLETLGQVFSLSQLLISTFDPIVLRNVASSSFAISAAFLNKSRENEQKIEPEWLKKLRFGISMGLLALNISQGANNLSVNIDNFQNQRYELEVQKDILKQHQIIVDNLDNPFKDGTMVTSMDAAVNVLMEAFDLNPLIEEKDRQIANNLRQYIKENPYFDYEKCYEDFASFDIVEVDKSNGIIGAINYDSYIEVYNTDDSVLSYDKKINHELVHYTGHLENKMLNEGMTTLICSEYMDDFTLTAGYYDEVLVTKIFCELITPEKMLEAYSTRDDKIIETELEKLGINFQEYQSLMQLMNNYHEKRSECENPDEMMNFYENNSPEFQKNLSNHVVNILTNANLSQEQKERIVIYLNYIGKATNVNGTIYFNKSAEIPGYEKAYSTLDESEMNLESGRYSY